MSRKPKFLSDEWIRRHLYPDVEWDLLMPDDISFGSWEMRYRMSDLLNRTTMAGWPSWTDVMFKFAMTRFLPFVVIMWLIMAVVVLR